jgi:hypothetical protein
VSIYIKSINGQAKNRLERATKFSGFLSDQGLAALIKGGCAGQASMPVFRGPGARFIGWSARETSGYIALNQEDGLLRQA